MLFALGTVLLLLLALWAYRFAAPPLPGLARRALAGLRFLGLALLLWLLAQPVVERAAGGRGTLFVLLDRSRSMALPATPGGASRATVAAAAAERLRRAWHGPAVVAPFAGRLAGDSALALEPGATAIGDALEAMGRSSDIDRASAVAVVSDGIVNAGADPVEAARSLGIPVAGVLVGAPNPVDRAIAGIDASTEAQVGRMTPVRVRIVTSEPRGVPIGVRLMDGARELGHASVISPGSGAEALAEFHVVPVKAGLALWRAVADSLPLEITTANNSRQVAVEVAPAKLGVVMISGGLNWDFAFLRRALAADSSLDVVAWVRTADGWTAPDRPRAPVPGADALRGRAVVLLDGIAPREVGPGFETALPAFVRDGGALIALGGPAPGVVRYRGGAFGNALEFSMDAAAVTPTASPEPVPEARDLLQWDDDPARGDRAWRAAAPLEDVAPIAPSAGDRVLVKSAGKGPPLLLLRHLGRGQALFVNGTGLWRWSLSGTDELSAERGRRLWRGLVHALAEPVQGEPLRVRPERWVTPSGEPVRLFATLQDAAFRPVAGASVEGELRDDSGRAWPLDFAAGSPGSYLAEKADLPPGHYRVLARATLGGRELGHATSELSVDRWSLEEARTAPDSATLAAMAAASGGRMIAAGGSAGGLGSLSARAAARGRTESHRLWESPWMFAIVVGALSAEWIWRRRRGLP